MHKLQVRIVEISEEEATKSFPDFDTTLRTEPGPLVRVTFTRPDGSLVREQVATLAECRVQPTYLQEV